MNIKILGTGCPNCQNLEKNTRQALLEMGTEARVEKINDIEKIMSYGIMSLPAMVVDEEVVSYGFVPGVAEIKKILTDKKNSSGNSSRSCFCGGGCC